MNDLQNDLQNELQNDLMTTCQARQRPTRLCSSAATATTWTTSSIRRPFRSCWCTWSASPPSGPASPGRRSRCAPRSTGCASSSSVPAITAISRIAPIPPAGCSSSCSRSGRRAPPRRACCGGRPSTATITCIPTPSATCIRRARRASWYSHVGWIFARRQDYLDLNKIADFAKFPELIWLNRFELVPAVALAVICYLVAGWSGLVVGFFWSTVLVFHGTFCINSLAHVHGRKRYVTGDDFRNNWLLALFTMGEGWHNNHHAYQSSVRQGFKWWEYDSPTTCSSCCPWAGWCGTSRRRRSRWCATSMAWAHG